MSPSHSLPILGGTMLLVAATAGARADGADPAAPLVPVASAAPAIPGLLLAAQSGRSLPGSRDALFGDDEESSGAADSGGRESPAEEEEPGRPEVSVPATRDALFGDGDETPASVATAGSSAARFAGVRGFFQNVMAYTWPEPRHWSEMMNRFDLAAQGELAPNVRWKLGARVDYDATYTFTNFYPQAVADDQRFNVLLRENYLDIGAGDWDFRLGRQQIVWGEMVGLLFGDVVSAKDMRQFILPRFEILRIPQWAARAEYFKDDVHAELVWIPVASYDNIGKPGSEFFAYTPPPPPGVNTVFLSEKFPARTLSNTNYGLRLSVLRDGWDVAGFAYSSMSVAPSFYREIIAAPQPTIIYQARHDRINQFGSTVAKDFGSVVLKGEAVYTRGRRYEVTNPTDSDGVVAQNAFTWVVGLDFNPTADTRINTQVFQNHIFDRDPYIIPSTNEYGFSLLVNQKIGDKVEVQALWIASLNRTDWMLRPRVSWNFEKNWGFAFGVDIFEGPPMGYFGRYDAKDRVYTELQYNF